MYVFFIDRNEQTVEEVLQMVESDAGISCKSVLVFSTLGRDTGSSLTLQFVERLAGKGIACKTIFSMPFAWEGKVSIERALKC